MDELISEKIEKFLKIASLCLILLMAGSIFLYKKAERNIVEILDGVNLVDIADKRTPLILNEKEGMDVDAYRQIDAGIYNMFNYETVSEQRQGITNFMGEDMVGMFIPFDDGTDDIQKGVAEKRRTFILDQGEDEYTISTYIFSSGNPLYLEQRFILRDGKFTRKDALIAGYDENIMMAKDYLKMISNGD